MATIVAKSIKFPFQRGSTSFPAMVEGDAVVQTQFTALITTGKFERVMRPQLGFNASGFIFETVTPIMRAQIAAELVQQARNSVPKATLLGVDVSEVNQGNGVRVVAATIEYAVAGQQISQQIPMTSGGG